MSKEKRLLAGRRLPVFMKFLIACLIFLLVLLGLPYAIPVSRDDGIRTSPPFNNSEFYQINGIELHARVWPQQTPDLFGSILMVHGLGGSTYSWEQSAAALAESGYRIVAVDLPGFGFSTRKPGLDHSQASRADLLWRLIDEMDHPLSDDISSVPWILIGHSMGAGTVAAMAMSRPDRCEKLIFVDGALFDNQPATAAQILRFPPVARWLTVFLEHVLITDSRISNILKSAYGVEPTPDQTNGYLLPLQRKGTARSLFDLTRTARNEPVAYLSDLAVPISAVWGEMDVITPLEQAFNLQTILPAMDLRIISGAGHMPMETHAGQFVALVHEILAPQR